MGKPNDKIILEKRNFKKKNVFESSFNSYKLGQWEQK